MNIKLKHNVLQVAVIPFRKHRGDLQILLISARGKKHWTVPKGYQQGDYALAKIAANSQIKSLRSVACRIIANSFPDFRWMENLSQWENKDTMPVGVMDEKDPLRYLCCGVLRKD